MTAPPADDLLILLGHPPAADYFHAIRTLAIGGEQADAVALARQWREASAHVRSLAQSETELARHSAPEPLPPQWQELAQTFSENASWIRSHEVIPQRCALIELDRLTVFQKRINLSWVERLSALIGEHPSAETVFKCTSGSGFSQPSVQVVRSDDSSYTFTCRSGELRFLGMKLLEPQPMGMARPTHVVGASIGFGLNRMSAVYYRDRLILTNGSHRAYALRKSGVTYAPCWLAEARHEDDLELMGVREVRAQLERCARAPRPPLLKDYFDSKLRQVIQTPRMDHAVQVQVTVRNMRIPAASPALP